MFTYYISNIISKCDILNNIFNCVKNFFVKTIYKFILTLALIIFHIN